jgi:hypothetical protein
VNVVFSHRVFFIVEVSFGGVHAHSISFVVVSNMKEFQPSSVWYHSAFVYVHIHGIIE